LSKLSKLKQEAYLAGKQRDWDRAVSIYEQILELEKNNPSLINELGDICLRRDEIAEAVSHFLNAAKKYRGTGLLNNAVAIYKKILRHDRENLNAHWYLAEIRADQGLAAEGRKHALSFLATSEGVSGDLKEIFLKRCRQLLSLYPREGEVLSRLKAVFKVWGLPLEEARAECLTACLQFEQGQKEEAGARFNRVLEDVPEVGSYPEAAAWREKSSSAPKATAPLDYNSCNLPRATPAESTGPAAAPNEPAASEPAASVVFTGADEPIPDEPPVPPVGSGGPEAAGSPLDTSPAPHGSTPGETELDPFQAVPAAEPSGSAPVPPAGQPEQSLDSLLTEFPDGQAAEPVADQAGPAASQSGPGPAPSEAKGSGEGTVDLLAEILAEEGEETGADLESHAVEQVQTIASEIGRRVGGEGEQQGAASHYEMGMVYLEMELLDEACDCFAKAVADAEFALRAYEMWGLALLRLQRTDEAVEVLARGMEIPEEDSPDQLPFLYHSGEAFAQADMKAEARQFYERVHRIDSGFLDVAEKLAELTPA